MFYYGLVHSNQDKYVKCGHARRFGSQSARLGRLRTTPLLQICSSFLPRGRDLELASEAEAITNLNWIKEASCDMARFVDHSGSPRHGEAGRTRSTSARRVGKSGRDGGCGESNHLPSQNMSGPPVTSAPFNAADVKAFYCGEKDAPIFNKGVILSQPLATRSSARARTCFGGYVQIRNNT